MKPTKAEVEKLAKELCVMWFSPESLKAKDIWRFSACWILERFERRAPSKSDLARTRKSFMKTLDEYKHRATCSAYTDKDHVAFGPCTCRPKRKPAKKGKVKCGYR